MEIWQQRSSLWCCNGGICVLSNAEMAQSKSRVNERSGLSIFRMKKVQEYLEGLTDVMTD